MKIIKLNAENIKKLVAVEIIPSGDIVTIAGKNRAGKTSVLDSIYWALAGTSHVQSQPIRKGENKARIKLDLGELIVERKFTINKDGETTTSISVENAEGARFPSPQKMLDALLGELSFDPLAFSRMEPRKQFDELRRVSELDVDIDKLDALNKGDYAKRTDINRDAKAKRAQAEGIAVPAGEPVPLVDESALVDELQKAGEHNTELATREARRKEAQDQANRLKQQAVAKREHSAKVREAAESAYARAGDELQAAIKKMKSDADTALKSALADADAFNNNATDELAKAAEIEKKIDAAPALPKPVEVTELRQKIEQARASNKLTTERQQAAARKAQAIKEAAELEAQSKALTDGMEAREKAKADAIARAKLPVAGIGFGSGVVTYNDIPFEQASSAEQLRVSMSIAMAANPKLRVIRITDGSLLDDDSLAAITAMAKAGDYQVWLEVVDSSGKLGIVIEDGRVRP